MLIGQKFGPFLIDKELGSGAMGTVYRATFEKTGQIVALKVMIPGLSGSGTAHARFEREIEILKQLHHPNIVRLVGGGRSKTHGVRYYAMEYIEGEPLDKVVQRRGKLPWEELVTLGQQLCSALHHAHQQGIIHRDLKPSNLMMLDDGTIKLTDFGIAKDLDVTQLTAANCTVGTAAYMSPEQCRGDKSMNFKSDLYSLGIVLYEFLTGRKPFQAQSPMDMFLQHIKGTFERPSRVQLDVPIWLDTLVCQLLEKKPEHRPRDAAAVAEALGRISEKVTAQRSAGVELVGARAVDRPARTRIGVEDRETARALQTAVTGRQRKRRRTPIYQRGWFIAASIVLVLGILSGLIYLVAKPDSPETLFARAEKLMASEDADDWDRAIDPRSGPVTEYLRRYGTFPDGRTAQVQRWSDLAHAALKERQLANRLKFGKDPDDDAERAAQNAVRSEESGDLAAARTYWENVLKHQEDTAIDGPTWALVAQKHLRDLQDVSNELARWQRQVNQARREGKPYRNEDERELIALRATHFELFGDEQGAREAWAALRLVAPEDKSNERRWKLLKARNTFRARDLAASSKEQRVEHARKQLERAEDLADSDPIQARTIYRDLVMLYRDAPEFADVVRQAQSHSPKDEN
ncbi:MAG TPA: protein kinase [Gemmataceae bacterium]|nr:protein kinase [Gemmataceae bacterium]